MTTHPRLLAALALLTLAPIASAAIFNVTSPLDLPDLNPGNGVCNTGLSGVCTLRAAVMEANAVPGAHTINLTPGVVYTLVRAGDDANALNGDLDITGPVTIQCPACNPNGSNRPVVNANNVDRAFDIFANNVILQGFDITGGRPLAGAVGGGAILIGYGQGTVQLRSMRFYGNQGDRGSAIYSRASDLRITDSEFFDNQRLDPDATSASVIFSGSDGGLTIERSAIFLNLLPEAIRNGGIHTFGNGHLNVFNTTISGNGGSGIRVEASGGSPALTLRNTTIVDNLAVGLAYVSDITNQTLVLRNSIIARNHQSNCSFPPGHAFDLNGHNLSNTTCQLAGGASNLPNNANPRLTPLKRRGGLTHLHWPRIDSPVLSAGSTSIQIDQTCRVNDQNGIPRPQGFNGIVRCDVGAAEVPDDAIFFDSLETL